MKCPACKKETSHSIGEKFEHCDEILYRENKTIAVTHLEVTDEYLADMKKTIDDLFGG